MIDVLFWIALVVALVASLLVWIVNLKVNSSTSEQQTGSHLLGWAWGTVVALAVIKLMMMR